ncbi:MAG: GntG family PLP-dependent aldolase [Chloroflexota bacterium]
MAAEVGDDVYGEDPTVRALEERAADLLAKKAGLFVPSGTMGNLLATMTHTRPGDEVICGQFAHTYIAEPAGGARLAGVSTWTVPQHCASFAAEDVHSAIHPSEDPHYPRTALVWLEQPNRGWTMPPRDLAAIAEVAHTHGLPVHMEGARIFNAAIALELPAHEVARHVDSVMFCVSKGLAAPVGSMLVGDAAFIAAARRNRKVIGGAMRQAGILAAAGLYALEHMVERLADDHRHAHRLADGLLNLGWQIDRERVETNIFFVEPTANRPPGRGNWRLAGARRAGRLPYTGRTLRLATHYGIGPHGVAHALAALPRSAANRPWLGPAEPRYTLPVSGNPE